MDRRQWFGGVAAFFGAVCGRRAAAKPQVPPPSVGGYRQHVWVPSVSVDATTNTGDESPMWTMYVLLHPAREECP